MEPRRVVIVVYQGIQSLDAVGPLEVFATANREAGRAEYATEIVATTGPTVRAMSGLTVGVERRLRGLRGRIDTLVVAGGDGTIDALRSRSLIDGITRLATRSRRVTSVCTGAFLLAEAGLLDGRRATTHWSVCDTLARRYPTIDVDPDPIFVCDGNVYTSAGVTAGMDLALALVEDDLGRDLALRVARRLVMFLRRPGNQSQFSAQLAAQVAHRDPLRDVQQWIADHPDDDLTVAALAERAGMSDRNFARCFKDEVGVTPGRYVEIARVEVARRLLEDTDDAIGRVARAAGFGTTETMRRVFLRVLRTGPTEYRRRFRADAA
ncbi:MAG TPA: GlxA family transcriptional regulator [Acidimicrobiales bacterium]|nr:GlxA family transcriptional regulator [Acidimicrobiales bacterium]